MVQPTKNPHINLCNVKNSCGLLSKTHTQTHTHFYFIFNTDFIEQHFYRFELLASAIFQSALVFTASKTYRLSEQRTTQGNVRNLPEKYFSLRVLIGEQKCGIRQMYENFQAKIKKKTTFC